MKIWENQVEILKYMNLSKEMIVLTACNPMAIEMDSQY